MTPDFPWWMTIPLTAVGILLGIGVNSLRLTHRNKPFTREPKDPAWGLKRRTRRKRKKNMRNKLPLLIFLLAAGCIGTSKKLNRVELGMDKNQVEHAIGRPHAVSARTEGTNVIEYLNYHWLVGNDRAKHQHPYFVRLTNGKVDMFGEKGDFDTIQTPIERKRIEIIKH